MANVDAGDRAVGLAPSTTHTSLQSIGTGARQHLVDADDVVRVGAHAQVETFLAGHLDEVLIGTNPGSLEGLGAQLLILVGDEVDAQREVVDGRALPAEVEDANLGIGDTTVEAGLRVRLRDTNVSFKLSPGSWLSWVGASEAVGSRARCRPQRLTYLILAVPVTSGRATRHFEMRVRLPESKVWCCDGESG